MVEKHVEALVEFAAKVLYHVLSRKISHDLAFQSALREAGKLAKHVPLKILYRVSRSVISDYYMLRYAEERIYGGRGGAKRLARLWLVLRSPMLEDLLAPYASGIERLRRRLLKTMPRRVESIEELIEGIEDPAEKVAVELSYPKWLVENLSKHLGLEEARRLLEELNEEKWWIRVNTLKADVDTIAERLEEKGVVVRRDPDLPYMLQVVDYSEPLHHLEEMWRGEIVFQDKASAMVVEALEPEPGDVILDMAAAPGVKDTLIHQLTGGRARVIAVDVSWDRTRRMKRLLSMYGVYGPAVDIVNADSRQLPLMAEQATKILLDAPCTSTGAIGKDPAIKIHLEDPSWVERFPRLQAELLRVAVSLRKTVVYATCSLLAEEGEEQVERYQGFLVEPRIPGSPGYPTYGFSKLVRRFFPHIHNTQGFFIARIEARSGM